LTLVAWGLGLGAQLFKKLFTAPEIGLRQLAMIFYKIPDQIIVGSIPHATSFTLPAGDVSVTVTSASVSIQTLAPQLKGLSGL